ncbi:MAG TPA: hypothetical protein VGJ21_06895, partial [Terracidiphilus sp.]
MRGEDNLVAGLDIPRDQTMVSQLTSDGILGTGFIALCSFIIGFAPATALAQPRGSASTSNAQSAPPPEDHPDLLDGTLSGKGDQEADDQPTQPWLRAPTALAPWFAFKRELMENYGLAISGSYGVLGQNYSNSLTGQDNSVGGKFTLNVGYQMFNRGKPNALWLETVIEDRRPLGTDFAPLQAGLQTGSATATAPTWGDFPLGVTQFYLRQNLFNNSFQYAIGKLFAPNFVNPYPLFDDNRQYLSQMFTTSITIPVPLRG